MYADSAGAARDAGQCEEGVMKTGKDRFVRSLLNIALSVTLQTCFSGK